VSEASQWRYVPPPQPGWRSEIGGLRLKSGGRSALLSQSSRVPHSWAKQANMRCEVRTSHAACEQALASTMCASRSAWCRSCAGCRVPERVSPAGICLYHVSRSAASLPASCHISSTTRAQASGSAARRMTR